MVQSKLTQKINEVIQKNREKINAREDCPFYYKALEEYYEELIDN